VENDEWIIPNKAGKYARILSRFLLTFNLPATGRGGISLKIQGRVFSPALKV
jgi:hypothetical protein